jgi:hypothetical protein
VLQLPIKDERTTDPKAEMQVDHISRAATGPERELTQCGSSCVIFEHRSNTESILDDTRQWEMFETWDPVRALCDATIRVDGSAESDANSLDDGIVDVATAHDRFDEPANGIDRHRRVRAVTNGVGAVDYPTIRVGERNTMAPTADFNGDG